MGDIIKAPSHYVDGRKYEPKDVIRDWGLNFNLGSAVKYISRAGRKGDKLEDLQKAKQFLEFEIEADEKEEERRKNDARYGWICTRHILNGGMKFEQVSEYLKPLVLNDLVDEVLNGMVDISSNILSDELRKLVIDRIVERINNGELDCFDIPGNLYTGYLEIRNALIIQELRNAGGVIDRIVEGINNGELKLKDIPTGLYEERGKIQAAIANSKYRKAADAIRKYAEDTEDTVSINFEFEVDPEIDTDTVNVHVHIKNKED